VHVRSFEIRFETKHLAIHNKHTHFKLVVWTQT